MTTAYFLIPGARLPAAAASDILPALTHEERALLARLGDGRTAPAVQRLTGSTYRHAPHWSWCWRVIGSRGGNPVEAPARWRASGSPTVDGELRELLVLERTDRGFACTKLEDSECFRVLGPVGDLLGRFGLRLQVDGSALYAAARSPMAFDALPSPAFASAEVAELTWEALLAHGLEAHPDAPSDALERVRGLLENLKSLIDTPPFEALNADRAAKGRAPICAFWLSTGGRIEGLYPPSKIRAVLADDPVIRGWALSAGIPAARVQPLSRKTGEADWPAAPEGELLAVIDCLYAPWLAGDWTAWRQALPRAVETYEALLASARARRADESLLVLFGLGGAASLSEKPTGLLNRLTGRRAGVDPSAWIADTLEEIFR